MSLPELIAALEGEARAEAEQRLAQAREAAATLRVERREARERRRATSLAELEAELEQREREELSRSRRDARRTWLEARAAAVERTLARLGERLGEPEGLERIRRAVPGWLDEAFRHVGEGPCVVRCGTQLLGVVGPLVTERPEAKLVVDASVPRRLLVESREGCLVVEATPDELLRSRHRRLAVEACRSFEQELGLHAAALQGRAGDEEA